MKTFVTDQEQFWAGDFGNEYIERNNPEHGVVTNATTWSRMLRCANGVSSIRELGCNIGLNLRGLHVLDSSLELSAVEINELAVARARELQIAEITHATILEKLDLPPVDLTFTSGVLIHINPDHLHKVYDNLVTMSKRYVLVAEYYNPTPVTVDYRGHQDRIFKRDFAGELIDGYAMKLVDYGFVYHRDNCVPRDDINWFLLEK